MTENIAERVYKSIWHALIAAMGFYELRNHKTKLSKVLAVGLIAFHVMPALQTLWMSQQPRSDCYAIC